MDKHILLGFLVFFFSTTYVLGLECYVCENQEDNNEKCVKTIKNCEYNQDVCLTEIKWGSTPYWSQGAKKQYYISKRCSNKTECSTTRRRYMPLCTHIWYQDWVCSDCCLGDRCNYYVISGSEAVKPVLLILSGLLVLNGVHNILEKESRPTGLLVMWDLLVATLLVIYKKIHFTGKL